MHSINPNDWHLSQAPMMDWTSEGI